MRYKFLLLLLTLSFASCAISNTAIQPSEIPAKNSENAIVFVVFKIKKGQINSTVEVVSNTKSSGTMKRQTENTLDSNNSLTIEILKDNKVFQTITMNHPLFKSVEFVENNGQFNKKQVELEEDTFFIRFQTMGVATSIKISETLTDVAKKEIANIKL
jgi:hypothetical protein